MSTTAMKATRLMVAMFLVAVLLVTNPPAFAADPNDYPGSIDNLDGTYTLVYQPSGGSNDGTDQGGIAGGKDAFVLANESPVTANTNYGQASYTHHFNSTCNPWQGWSYHQWDVSALPPVEDIVSVTLVLYQKIGRGYGWGYQNPTTTMLVQAPAAPWNEMTLSWNNKPALQPEILSQVVLPTPNLGVYDSSGSNIVYDGYAHIDITELYKDWKTGARPNHGIVYRRSNAWCENANFNYVYTSDNPDSALRPQVEIVYLGGTAEDTTPPVITPVLEGVLGNDGWYTSDVTVSWTVTDDESDEISITGGETVVVTGDTPGVTFTCEAVSAGGSATASVTVKRDATAPMITIAAPQDGSEYIIGEAVEADWEAADGMSGLADDYAGAIDTATPGAKTFTVTAVDTAGNQATLTHDYSVLSAADAIDRLIARVRSLNLHKGAETSLIAKLNAAKSSLIRKNATAAVNQLGAFINEAEAQSGKKVSASDSDDLISQAARIIEAIR